MQKVQKKPVVLSIVAAQSDTGKTTLIEKLIPYLKQRNYRVGVIKHDVHRFEIDKEGKDSYRFGMAGADTVVVSSAEKMAMIKKLNAEMSMDEILSYFPDVDIVLIEGYKNNAFSKIEVFRQEAGKELLFHMPNFKKKQFLAVASDIPLDLPIPVLDLNDIDGIGAFVEKNVLKGASHDQIA